MSKIPELTGPLETTKGSSLMDDQTSCQCGLLDESTEAKVITIRKRVTKATEDAMKW